MNKVFKISSLVLSGALIGVIAGKITNNDTVKVKRSSFTKNVKSVKNYLKKSDSTDGEDINQYFV